MILLSLLSLGLLVASLTRADINHIFQALVIFLPLLALMLEIHFLEKPARPIIFILLDYEN